MDFIFVLLAEILSQDVQLHKQEKRTISATEEKKHLADLSAFPLLGKFTITVVTHKSQERLDTKMVHINRI